MIFFSESLNAFLTFAALNRMSKSLRLNYLSFFFSGNFLFFFKSVVFVLLMIEKHFSWNFLKVLSVLCRCRSGQLKNMKHIFEKPCNDFVCCSAKSCVCVALASSTRSNSFLNAGFIMYSSVKVNASMDIAILGHIVIKLRDVIMFGYCLFSLVTFL